MNRSGQVTSRMARREQKKLVKQTVLFLVLAVILILGFFFVILPNFIRLVSNWGSSDAGSSITDSLPPQIPVLAAPPVATPSAELTITGFGEKGSQVVSLVNSTEAGKHAVGDDGSFTFTINLTEGENTLSVYAIDQAENESATGKTYTIIRDSSAPKLEITEPTANQEFQTRKNQTITIKGTTDPEVRIMVNGHLAFAQKDGAFTTTYSLQDGEKRRDLSEEGSFRFGTYY